MCAGAIYHSISKGPLSPIVGAVAAGIVSPVVNTGLFCLCLTLLFHDILVSWAGGTDIVYYIIFVLTGINFVLEMVINLGAQYRYCPGGLCKKSRINAFQGVRQAADALILHQ